MQPTAEFTTAAGVLNYNIVRIKVGMYVSATNGSVETEHFFTLLLEVS